MLPSDGFEILHREVAAVRDRETLASPVKASTPERSVLGQGEFQPTHDLGGKVVQEGKDH